MNILGITVLGVGVAVLCYNATYYLVDYLAKRDERRLTNGLG